MKRYITTAAIAAMSIAMLATTAAPSWARDMDFPKQRAAVDRCYAESPAAGRPPTHQWDDRVLIPCMERQNLYFCPNCKVDGHACRHDNSALDYPGCYRSDTSRNAYIRKAITSCYMRYSTRTTDADVVNCMGDEYLYMCRHKKDGANLPACYAHLE
jgi:hypothetical protein